MNHEPKADARAHLPPSSAASDGDVHRMRGGSAPWLDAPLFGEGWCDLPPALAEELLERIDLTTTAVWTTPFTRTNEVERIRVAPASFYPGFLFVDVQVRISVSQGRGPAIASFLYGPEGALLLDGASSVFHDLNRRRLDLGADKQRLDYVRAFCAHVRGESSPFAVVETIDDLRLRPRTRHTTRTKLAALVQPLRLIASEANEDETPEAISDDAAFRVEAAILYAGTLFRSRFRVASKTGMIEMTEDDPIRRNLPVTQWTYDSCYRMPAASDDARSAKE